MRGKPEPDPGVGEIKLFPLSEIIGPMIGILSIRKKVLAEQIFGVWPLLPGIHSAMVLE